MGYQTTSSNTDGHLDALCQIAKMSNFLAKQLDGSNRALAYNIKARLCSELIIEGVAVLDGVRENAILGLTLQSNPPTRLHVPLTHLSVEAQAVIRRQTAPAVAPLGDCWHS